MRRRTTGLLSAASCALLLAVGGACATAWAQGQPVVFQAEVDRNALSLDETLALTVTVEASGNQRLGEPTLASSPDFVVVGSPQREEGYNIVNMQVSRTSRRVFALRPRRTGRLKVPVAKLVANGRTVTTSPITVTVTAGAALSAQPSGPLPGPTPTPPAGAPFQGTPEFAILCKADKQSVYVNEQLTLDVEYYAAFHPSQSMGRDSPQAQGFVAEDLPGPEPEYVTVGDQQYIKMVARWALFATSPGPHTVQAAPEEVMAPPTYSSRQYRSNVLPITVKALPPAPVSGFSGAVGEFTIQLSSDKTQVKAGEGMTVKVAVDGAGNLQAVTRPRLGLPAWCKVYDSGDKRNVEPPPAAGGGRVAGHVEFQYLVVPRREGPLEIPAASLVYFRPQTGQYATATSDRLAVTVTPGAVMEEAAGEGADHSLRHIHTDHPRLYARTSLLLSPVPYLLLALCLGALAVEAVRRVRDDRRRADPLRARAAGAARAATRALARLESAPEEQFRAGLGEVVGRYLSDRFGVPASGLVVEALHRELLARGVSEQVAAQAQELVALCQTSRFAPGGAALPRAEALERARRVIAEAGRGGARGGEEGRLR